MAGQDMTGWDNMRFMGWDKMGLGTMKKRLEKNDPYVK